jgi:sugar phosphate isomerase/epimerase
MHSSEANSISRRHFIATSALALSASSLLSADAPTARTKSRFQLVGFIKPFQKLPYEQIAELVSEVGWNGIECPVRKGGAIEPERAEDELPRLVESLRKRDVDVPVLATDVEDAAQPLTQKVLKTASKLGIRRYRLKHYYYDLNQPITPQLKEFGAKLRDLAQLNKELNVQGGIQNHSGRNYVGAPVWDIWELIRDLDPKFIGIFFDVGHAHVEGGLSWPIEAKLAEPHLSTVSVKDFVWKKSERGWRNEWCPLGEGMVGRQFFDFLKKTNFAGPVSQHFEYPLGTGKEMIAAMKKELGVLKHWLGA